jgi:hypothetical protein
MNNKNKVEMAFFHNRKQPEAKKIQVENTIDSTLPLRADHGLRETPKNAVLRGGVTSLNKTYENEDQGKPSSNCKKFNFRQQTLI